MHSYYPAKAARSPWPRVTRHDDAIETGPDFVARYEANRALLQRCRHRP
jgi:hypothetical protein